MPIFLPPLFYRWPLSFFSSVLLCFRARRFLFCLHLIVFLWLGFLGFVLLVLSIYLVHHLGSCVGCLGVLFLCCVFHILCLCWVSLSVWWVLLLGPCQFCMYNLVVFLWILGWCLVSFFVCVLILFHLRFIFDITVTATSSSRTVTEWM